VGAAIFKANWHSKKSEFHAMIASIDCTTPSADIGANGITDSAINHGNYCDFEFCSHLTSHFPA
jgi:hypothetical protein